MTEKSQGAGRNLERRRSLNLNLKSALLADLQTVSCVCVVHDVLLFHFQELRRARLVESPENKG